MESDDEHRTGTFLEPETLKEVLGLFSLFHPSYEFYKDDIIQLWMARDTDFGWMEITDWLMMANWPETIGRRLMETTGSLMMENRLRRLMMKTAESLMKGTTESLMMETTESLMMENRLTRLILRRLMMETTESLMMKTTDSLMMENRPETIRRRLMETTERLMMENRLTRLETIGRRLVDTETIYMKLQMKEITDAIIRKLEDIDLTLDAWGIKTDELGKWPLGTRLKMEEMVKMSQMMEVEFNKVKETNINKMESLEMELDRVKTTQINLKRMLNDIDNINIDNIIYGTRDSLMESRQLGLVPRKSRQQLKNEAMPIQIIQRWVDTETKGIDAFKLETEVSSIYFDHLERIQLIVMAADLDSMTSLPRYKVNHGHPLWVQNKHCHNYIRADGGESSIPANTLHCSIGDVTIDPITLKKLQQAKLLQTLIIHRSLHLHQFPRELFPMLPYLRILDLSGTNIKELPSSIGKSLHLKYLDLSGTLITTLPYSLFRLWGMQTLKLRGCIRLVCLPRDITKLRNLLHLDVDVACLLASMPPGIGNLTQLRKLPAFVVGEENGCRITELKNMKLYGTLSIFRLEYVYTGEEAAEADLIDKSNLRTLELQWTQSCDGSQILDNLRPPTQIKELQIVGYGGAKLSSWLGDPVYFTLTTITIHDCRSCTLPPLGKLPCLTILCISGMGEVDEIDNQFCGRLGSVLTNDYMFKAFPCLESLTLDEMPKLEKWLGIEKGDFPRLQKLNISSCPQLTTLPELSILESLEQLEISSCPLLEYFLTKGLPTSLQYLVIIDCPLLKEWFREEEGQDGGHVPSVWIDYHQMSLVPRA